MRIGFDAKRLFHNTTGLGHYSRTLIQHLLNNRKDLEMVLYDAAPTQNDLTLPFYNHEKIKIVVTGYPHWYYRSINLNKFVNKDKLDLFHGLSNELPMIKIKNIPQVVTIHDLLYKHFPKDFPWPDRNVYQIKSSSAIKNADCIITISETTKQDILNTFKISENKIKVIYQSYDPIFNQSMDSKTLQDVLAQYNLPGEYYYYVGAVTFRKNVRIIIEAMSQISHGRRLPLVIAGDGTKYQKELKKDIAQKGMDKWVFFLPNLPRQIVRELYNGAQAVIYPSLGEGFGLPVLESIAANVPVITSNISSLPEAGGDVAIYFDPSNAAQLASLLENFDRESYIKTVAEKRIHHLKKFNASLVASQYMDTIYKPLVNL